MARRAAGAGSRAALRIAGLALGGTLLAGIVVGCSAEATRATAMPSADASGMERALSPATGTPDPAMGAGPSAGIVVPAFNPTGNLVVPRSRHSATLLADGRVLVAGGTTVLETGHTSFTATAELYDPRTGRFTATGSMRAVRSGQTATLLGDGRVLLAGGMGPTGPLPSAELYDPTTGTFTATGSMHGKRAFHTATLLPNGSVLVAGGTAAGMFGTALSSVELYHPASGQFGVISSLKRARMDHTSTLLPDGRVLLAGGWNGNVVISSAELFSPVTLAWHAIDSMHEARAGHTATVLPGGKVLLVGGNNRSGSGSVVGAMNSAELFNPQTGAFTPTASLSVARGFHVALPLSGARVLILGGYVEPPHGAYDARSYWETTEIYNAYTSAFTPGPSMVQKRRDLTATLLPNGAILVVGGECHQVVGDHAGPLPLKSADLGQA